MKPQSSDYLEHYCHDHRIEHSYGAVVPNFGCSLESPGKLLGTLMLGFRSQRSWWNRSKVGPAAKVETRWIPINPVKRQDRQCYFHLVDVKAEARSGEPTYPMLPN